MKVELQNNGQVAVVTTSGPVTSGEVDAFRDAFLTWFKGAASVRNVVMDMGDVDFIDSTGLGALIVCLKRVAERGGDLRLARLQKKVRMVFEITRTYRVFEIFDTVAEAVQAKA